MKVKISIVVFLIVGITTLEFGCKGNGTTIKMIEKKWRFDTIYSKDLDNYIAGQKRNLDTIKNITTKEKQKHNLDLVTQEFLRITYQFNADSSMEMDFPIMGQLDPIQAKWFLGDDSKRIFIKVIQQKPFKLKINDSATATVSANIGEKDTFNIAELTNDKLVLTGKIQTIGNGTIILKAVK